MTPLLAILEWGDYAIIAFIVLMFTGGAAYKTTRVDIRILQLQRQLQEVQQKLDALLKHQGIVMPVSEQSDMSPELQLMARDPSQKIAAIKHYREENPGTGLVEAKTRIEEFCRDGR